MASLEKFAKEKGIDIIRLDVRETKKEAIAFFKSCGLEKWGVNPSYAKVKGTVYRGFYFQKDLKVKQNLKRQRNKGKDVMKPIQIILLSLVTSMIGAYGVVSLQSPQVLSDVEQEESVMNV